MTVNWRDIFELDIDDPELKAKVEGFLDYFQNADFPYARQNPQTGEITETILAGQQVLKGIAERLSLYTEQGLADALSKPETALRLGLSGSGGNSLLSPGEAIMDNGKFVIRSHDRTYTGDVQSGSHTISISLPSMSEPLPLGISIGTEYLRGAQYFGIDGQQYPVTVEGVLANELAHMDKGAFAEAQSIVLESIVTVTNGGVQREPSNSYINFSPESNGGYQTLREYESVSSIGPLPPHATPEGQSGQDLKQFNP